MFCLPQGNTTDNFIVFNLELKWTYLFALLSIDIEEHQRQSI